MTTTDDIEITASDRPGEALDVRRAVFIEEQDVAEAVEFDDKDEEARHFVARIASNPAGTARVRLVDQDTAKVERVAVHAEYRGHGVGKRVMEAAHEYGREAGRSRAIVHAQTRVKEFYESLGYESVGEVEDETGIPHVKMVRDL